MSVNTNTIDIAATATLSEEMEWPELLENDVLNLQRGLAKDKSNSIPMFETTPAVSYAEDDDSLDGESEKELLVVSPYTSRSHLLDMSSVERPSQLLARALTLLRAVRSDYATAPYSRAFNWSAVVNCLRGLLTSEKDPSLEEQRFYIVVFRSQVPIGTDRSRLGELDELAHEEAMQAGGLLKYWFGTPDKTGRNLATCVWRRRDDARLGGAGPGHAKAMQETKALYTEWKVQRLSLNIGKDAQSWSITEWQD